ncbi:HIT domain-containing protein [Aliikangiella sp. IMCC44359]|uniref:HIT domain-containing protein n=1 Tax=Aliikangiella sp. IMCC44359 TaxID=3459125 RepID=UPI00403B180D
MTNSNVFQLHQQLVEDSFILGEFELSSLLLINDIQFPWCVLVPRRANITEIYQLSECEQALFWTESSLLSKVLMDIFGGDKLNVAAIGNLVPQLHLHHVVRYKKDPCWPAPIWGKLPMKSYQAEKVAEIQQKLAEKLPNLKLKQIKVCEKKKK